MSTWYQSAQIFKTYNYDGDNQSGVTTRARSVRRGIEQSIRRSDRSHPMHTRYRTSQQGRAHQSPRQTVDPAFLEVEEQDQRRDTRADGNCCSTDDVSCREM